MQKETIRLGIKKTKNFQSYESSVEREIFYKDEKERKAIKNRIYAELRNDISEQMELDTTKPRRQ